MKNVIAVLILLVSPAVILANHDANLSDFPLTAKVLYFEHSASGGGMSPVTDAQTGAITGWNHDAGSVSDREEIQIGDKIYITSLWGRGGIAGGAGDSFPAAFGKRGRFETILLLGTNKKTGKAEVVTLRVIGQKVK